MSPEEFDRPEHWDWVMEDIDDQRDLLRENVRMKKALQEIYAAIGPELCGCEECQDACPGFIAEIEEALRILKAVLDVP